MALNPQNDIDPPDSAAVFAAALSLWQACHLRAEDEDSLNLSECYQGMDQFMREVMQVANLFEIWACSHIDFVKFNDVWSYHLEDKFGEACLAFISASALDEFDDTYCLRVAMRLRLPIKYDAKLPIPVDVTVRNPVPNSGFCQFRIQTVRDSLEDEDVSPYIFDDDPFDGDYGTPYFGLYGVDDEGLLEHIADRQTYTEAISLAAKLAPGVPFPPTPSYPAE